MALASISTRPTTTIAGCPRQIEVASTTTVLVLDDGRRITVDARPDPLGARRCRQRLNHLASVRIEGSPGHPTAWLRGVGNRLPVTLPVPIATALALVEAGVPASVRLTEAVEA